MITPLYLSKNRHATWLELFFDLVFVAVIGVVTHDLAHTHNGHIGIEQLARFPLVFIPVWWIWMTHTLFANRFDRDSREQRLITLGIMGLLVLMSTFVETSLEEHFSQFVALYAFIRLLMAGLYGYIHSRHSDEVVFAKDMALSITAGAAISLSALAFEGWVKFILFYAGIAVDMVWQIVLRHKAETRPIDRRHLVERVGLLAIIILGESVIAMVAALSDVSWQMTSITGAIVGFAMIGAIWWIYFDSFEALERSKRLTTANVLIYSHLFLCMGLLILANMIRHSILGDLDTPTFSLLAIIGLVFFYLGKQVPYWYAFPPWRKAIIGNTLVCVSITVASSFLPSNVLSLTGMMSGMLIYVYLTHKRILSVSVDQYLDSEAH
ncbi:low temperature requirement protein A [Pontibacterium sp. N1Y112]|uniref:Low temperature requirement protein A n=1 Tax=Pontibacterium sinense TaxID=2781979 RepID=A0A8J7FKF2_9GAMM|nr:low temperature requirement protein A [Pontibacterium sinense]MBE9399713.1 low temperature requirement protein A [Pontibacterium sinense]